jgi:hypothetical protein
VAEPLLVGAQCKAGVDPFCFDLCNDVTEAVKGAVLL